MYTAIKGFYENGKVTLQEAAPTNKSTQVLVVFVEENFQVLHNQATAKQTVEGEVKPHFSLRWRGQFDLNGQVNNARMDYLKHRYKL